MFGYCFVSFLFFADDRNRPHKNKPVCWKSHSVVTLPPPSSSDLLGFLQPLILAIHTYFQVQCSARLSTRRRDESVAPNAPETGCDARNKCRLALSLATIKTYFVCVCRLNYRAIAWYFLIYGETIETLFFGIAELRTREIRDYANIA